MIDAAISHEAGRDRRRRERREHVLSDLFILRGVPGHIRSDNGPEFVAKAVQESIHSGRRQDRLHRAR